MARVYFRGLDADTLGITFHREGELVGKRALRKMRKVAKDTMAQSIRNSPLDYEGQTRNSPPLHELEKAHHIVEKVGFGNRIETSVQVGGTIGDVDVDRYAEWIHAGSEWSNLGKASLAKASADPRNKVGPEFLQRALEDHEADFDDLLDEIMDAFL
jgi:hypothetical protein